MINIVIPMAGEGSRFAKAGYSKPKPFIDVLGKPMIELVLENLNMSGAKFYLLVRKSHLDQETETLLKIKSKYDVTFIPVNGLTEGAACTILLAKNFIDNDQSLLIANSDQYVDFAINEFLKNASNKNLDGSILTFEDTDPKWSYARCDQDGFVSEVKEKEAISKNATVGIYYFKAGRFLVEAAEKMISRNDRVNNEFYTCPAYNYLIQDKKKIGIYPIEKNCMHGLGTPEDLQDFIKGRQQ